MSVAAPPLPAASMAPSESATSESGQRAAGRDSEAELARFYLGIYAAKSAAAAPPPSCLVTLIIGLRFWPSVHTSSVLT